jgi:hypothetical protein
MITLDKIEKIKNLQDNIDDLTTEIRVDQRNCLHEFDEKDFTFDDRAIHAICLKCGFNSIKNHDIIEINKLSRKERKFQLNQKFKELYEKTSLKT